MSDHTTIYGGLKCAYCGTEQEEVHYHENFQTHKCEKCGEDNLIIETYSLRKSGDN